MGVTATVQAQDLSFLTNGLVAYYPLNADANDYSGYGNDGTFVNVLTVPDRFGTPGGAAFTMGWLCFKFAAQSVNRFLQSGNTSPK